MSSILFEFKKNKNKNIFGTINSPKENNPIKLLLDLPNRNNSINNKLYDIKKYPKITQTEKNKDYINNHIDLKSKLILKKDENNNMRYYSNKKINKKKPKNASNDDDIINDNDLFSLKLFSTKTNKFINNNYNRCVPMKFKNNRKYIGDSPFSPLVSHSIDIINNNPFNKKRLMKIINKRDNEIKKLLNKNIEDSEVDFIKKNWNISHIKVNDTNEEKLKGNNSERRLSYMKNNQNDSDILNNKNYIKRKNTINELFIKDNFDNDNISNERKNYVGYSSKYINKRRKHNNSQFDKYYSKEIEKKKANELINNSQRNNELSYDKIEQIKKVILDSNRPSLKKYYYNNKNDEQKYYNENETINYINNEINENEDIECFSNDELSEYYVKKCNIVLEYAYKEDRNCSHKINMEDKGKSILNFNNDPNKLLFCLFDGHGGEKVADYLQKNFPIIMKSYICEEEDEEINFENLFKEIDQEFKNSKYYRMGSTATIIYITQDILINEKKLYCINIGDTKCILTHPKGSRKLTYDDLVSDEIENNRIINGGGYIKNGRVCGQLMISRAFGDWQSKPYGVICTPHVTKIDINDDHKFIIMASDGVWDVLDDLDVYKLSLTAENSKSLCNDIIRDALDKDSTDNLSCFVIKLND
jgi:serine/threonine protein phosphatase PrpC